MIVILLSALLLLSGTPSAIAQGPEADVEEGVDAHAAPKLPPKPATLQARQFVQDKITTNTVMVFSKTDCKFCVKAKTALGLFLQPEQMTDIVLDKLPASDNLTMSEVQDALYEVTGARSVPRVFIGGKFIGGGDETAAKAESGELKELLARHGLIKA